MTPQQEDIDVLRLLVREFMQLYPRPWTIEYDWTVEVHSGDQIVMKFMNDVTARRFISIAEQIDIDNVEADIWLKQQLGES